MFHKFVSSSPPALRIEFAKRQFPDGCIPPVRQWHLWTRDARGNCKESTVGIYVNFSFNSQLSN
jgi:hypothetical protein